MDKQNRMNIIVFAGPPLAGKSEQADQLSMHFKIARRPCYVIRSSDIARHVDKSNFEKLGVLSPKGELITNEVLAHIRQASDLEVKYVILDGFPREADQFVKLYNHATLNLHKLFLIWLIPTKAVIMDRAALRKRDESDRPGVVAIRYSEYLDKTLPTIKCMATVVQSCHVPISHADVDASKVSEGIFKFITEIAHTV